MTRTPVYCLPEDSVNAAADLMRTHDVGSLPVLEPGGSRRLVGIVTDRDLVVKIVAGNRCAETALVRDAMTAHPTSCAEHEDVVQALTLMAAARVRRLPVVDGEGRLVGIIAHADVANRIQRDLKTAELREGMSEPPSGR
jgi:CBS domain-containing protein